MYLSFLQEAIEVYKEAIEKRPSHYAPQSLYNMLGRFQFVRVNLIRTIDNVITNIYIHCVSSTCAHIMVRTLGEAHFKLDELSQAEHWYREALKAKTDHVPAHLTMAKLYHRYVRS